MQKITPHLWYDKEAKEAARFYTSIFPNSKIKNITTLHNTPSGDCDIVSFELSRQAFMAINAGPLFKFNPSISFLVACKTKEEVDVLWKKLSKEGSTLMELGSYPFSGRYAWLQDKYGLSWQLMLTDKHSLMQKITPTLMFTQKMCGKAEEAINLYISVFKNSKVNGIMRYGKGEEPEKEGAIKFASITLENQGFAALESAHAHNFRFSEAISFIVNCDSQEEIDYYWKLSNNKKDEQCGWLKDRFGMSWQIVPSILGEMLRDKDKNKLARVTEAFLKMKKFDIEKLKKVYL
ncbi:VOC family protein [Candidatus Woesearchaeota archaeon]|nr:VOC family protein [Candidatus Woesearchaeota archaeon]